MAEADGARHVGAQPGGAPRPLGPAQGLGPVQGYQPPPRAADNYTPPAAAPEPAQPASTNPSSSANLMRTVILILGLALLLLIVFDGIAALEGKTTDDLNSLISLIAGGFVGYLTPHIANAVKGGGSDNGEG